jgi:hypothetical protein
MMIENTLVSIPNLLIASTIIVVLLVFTIIDLRRP